MTAFRLYHQHTLYRVPHHACYLTGPDEVTVFVYVQDRAEHLGRIVCRLSTDGAETRGDLPEDVVRAIIGWIRGGYSVERYNEQERSKILGAAEQDDAEQWLPPFEAEAVERKRAEPLTRRPRARRGADPVIVPREVHRWAMGERGGGDV